jgi:hypothetical protein
LAKAPDLPDRISRNIIMKKSLEKPLPQLHAGDHAASGGKIWHTDMHGLYWSGNASHRSPEALLRECESTVRDLLANHPQLRPAPTPAVVALHESLKQCAEEAEAIRRTKSKLPKSVMASAAAIKRIVRGAR